MTKNNAISLIIKITVSALLVYFIVTRFSVTSIIETIKRVDAKLFLSVLFLWGAGNVLMFTRWYIILKYLEVPVGVLHASRCYMMGLFFNFFMPTAVGGDFLKAYYVDTSSERSSFKKRLFSVFLDRYLGLIVLLGMGSVFSLFINISIYGVKLAYALPALFASVILVNILIVLYGTRISRGMERVGFLKRLAPSVEKITEAMNFASGSGRTLFYILVCSFLGQLLICFMHQVFIRTITSVNSFFAVLVFVPVTALFTAIPITINGIGVREIAYVALFETIGVDPNVAIAMSVLFYSVIVISAVPGAICFLWELIKKRKPAIGG